MTGKPKLKPGQFVTIHCINSISRSTEKITAVEERYNDLTNKKYYVICVKNHEFDARSGRAITPPLKYFINI